MSKITIKREILAPVNTVFKTVSDIRNFSKAVPEIVNVEFLTDQKTGVGTKFRETREFNGRKASTELEVKEYAEGERIQMVSDSHGAVWDLVFTVTEMEGGTELTLEMDAKSYKFSARLMNLFMKRFIKKAVANDMDAVKDYCEK